MSNDKFVTLTEGVKVPIDYIHQVYIDAGMMLEGHTEILKASRDLIDIFAKSNMDSETAMKTVRYLNERAAEKARIQLTNDISKGENNNEKDHRGS